MRAGLIYHITCSANGGTYVGSTIRSARQRWSEHLWYLRKGKHHSKRMQNCYNKHGEESLVFTVVEQVADALLVVAREQFHIWRIDSDALMNSAPVSDATHCAMMANRGRVQSPEERAKRSASLLAARVTHVWSDERRKAHSVALTGRKMPPATKERGERISAAKKGKKPTAEAIAARIASRLSYITNELPGWLQMKADGLSYRKIEEITGRCRKVIARECAKAVANG